MYYSILDSQRLTILPLFKPIKNKFYLAGGTALALQLGHRDSIDFDFFTSEDIDTRKLFEELQKTFVGHTLIKTQEELNTLTIIINTSIKVSFFTHTSTLIRDAISEEYITVASIEDIACMKLTAITSRASNKDYIDLYFILKQFSLRDILEFSEEKYPSLDRNLILKSLIYFEDITHENILYRNNMEVPFDTVKKRLREEVKKVA